MIRISISNGRALIWDMQDVQELRLRHITGVLSGTLPQLGQQNVFLGLPLILYPEEVVLLVKNGFAVLVDGAAAHEAPSNEQVLQFVEERDSNFQSQQLATVAYDKSKKDLMEARYKDVIAQKRIEKQKLKAKAVELEGSFELLIPDLPPTALIPPTPTDLSNSIPAPVDLTNVPYQINLVASSSSLPWFNPTSESITYSTLESAAAVGLFNYPATALQKVKCKVFEDLWKKGFFLGGGLKFGGDFLIYPGDPLRYHSHFTLTVLASPQSAILPLDLVAYGRLATAVKKAHLLSTWNEKTDEAEYFSLEWAAFG